MTRNYVAIAALVAATMLGAADNASAGGWAYGGSYGGGSYGGGSFGGSWGGSQGSWGSRGSHGGLFYRWGYRHHVRRHHWFGSWGSHGGSFGGASYGSHGSYGGGSYGSHGGYTIVNSCGSSGGGVIYSSPVQQEHRKSQILEKDAPPAGPAEGDAKPDAGAKPEEKEARRFNDSILTVKVDDDARVFVNGMKTRSTGSRRQFVSRNLRSGLNYTFEIRAEATRNGKKVEETKLVKVRSGENVNVAFDLKDSSPATTTLTLKVPEKARVTLSGNKTTAEGSVRVFRTTQLAVGQKWNNYVVRVELERDGKTIAKEKTIALIAGEARELAFDFDAEVDKVADAR